MIETHKANGKEGTIVVSSYIYFTVIIHCSHSGFGLIIIIIDLSIGCVSTSNCCNIGLVNYELF